MNPEQHNQSIEVQSAGSGQERNGQPHETSNEEPGLVSLHQLVEELAADVLGAIDAESHKGIERAKKQLEVLERFASWQKRYANARAEPGRVKARNFREWSLPVILIHLVVVGTVLVAYGLLQDATLIRPGAYLLLPPGAVAALILGKGRSRGDP